MKVTVFKKMRRKIKQRMDGGVQKELGHSKVPIYKRRK